MRSRAVTLQTRRIRIPAMALVLVLAAGTAAAELTVETEFDPSEAGTLCGVAVNQVTGDVWVHQCAGSDVQGYSSAGALVATVNRPGETANDVDLDFSLAHMTIASTAIEAGTLLFVNGENESAEVYAVDPSTGAVLETLSTSFGTDHVVGDSHHPGRDSLFLVQDRIPPGDDANRIGEVDPITGALLNTFRIDAVFDVNYGDIDICPSSGNLFVVSSIESRIAELTPDGTLVAYHDLPAGVGGLSGIAVDGTVSDLVWVSGTGGTVWALDGFPCASTQPLFADGFESGDTSRWN